jgi:hypothetical protein
MKTTSTAHLRLRPESSERRAAVLVHENTRNGARPKGGWGKSGQWWPLPVELNPLSTFPPQES